MANRTAQELKLIAQGDPRRAYQLAGYTGDLKPSGDCLVGICPFHHDTHPSFTVFSDGAFKCFGCDAHGSVIDFFSKLHQLEFKQACPELATRLGLKRQTPTTNRSDHRNEYELRDAENGVVAVHVRLDRASGGKIFWWEKDGLQTLSGLRTEQLPLYGGQKLSQGAVLEPVLVVEGEKACEALWGIGTTAMATVCGAAVTPCERVLLPLLEHAVVLWPDSDEGGHKHMRRIADRLLGMGHNDLWLMDWREAPEKGDAWDFIQAGGNQEELQALICQATPAEQSGGSNGGDCSAEVDELPSPTDFGNARILADRLQGSYLFVDEWGWLRYTGTHWVRDGGGHNVLRDATNVLAECYLEKAKAASSGEQREEYTRLALKVQSRRNAANAVEMAKGLLLTESALFDADAWLLNLQNGTLDLRTGQLRTHSPQDFITKLSPVQFDPAAEAPRFRQYLEEIFEGRQEVIRFVQQIVGYTLTGDTSEQLFFMLYGTGQNGKSTLLETLRSVLGDYAQAAEFSTFSHNENDRVRNDLAALRGARMVSAMETQEGRRLAEPVIKQLTGGDTIAARFLFHELFQFRPAFKLFLGVNHKPVIRDTTHAMWRRVRLIPFTVTISKDQQDKHLSEKLVTEASGILNWAVQGCMDWQLNGLLVPGEVRDATNSYQQEMDMVASFLEDRCLVGDGLEATAKALYGDYCAWCEENGERASNQTVFGRRLTEKGFESARNARGKVRRGVGLLQPGL